MADHIVRVQRALISVSHKEGLTDRIGRLIEAGAEIVSTGGTRTALEAVGTPVTDVAEITKFPEMMGGRVKTLHPAVHGGLLYRRDDPAHRDAASEHGIEAIDLIYVNLYPFEATVAGGADFDTCVENIDIGGPAMIRAAAKNAVSVAVCTDAADVDAVLAEIDSIGGTSLELRRRLAAKAYARTAAYDAAISKYFADQLELETPDWTAFGGELRQALRYGENPHQSAAFYVDGTPRPGVATARQIQGKALSYNNINDTDAAFELVAEFGRDAPAVAIIKHANPSGAAVADSPLAAYRAALACDPVSAFGGIIAFNHPLDEAAAAAVCEIFTEVVIAPDASDSAMAVFAQKKNLRLLLTDGLPDPTTPGRIVKSVAGGFLVQSRDNGHIAKSDFKVATKRAPTDQELIDLEFAWRVAKHVKSNAIVYAKDLATVGIGAGQMSRIDSARIAALKAQDAADASGRADPLTRGCVAASDAFFPFADGLLQAADSGATAIIQPGGSVRDDEVIAAADDA
ncbi:MAG: bifunctional phosphoribosylaminoimidazolecarboxamide formyltransferase/IMP cyclohydrolase, partial [Pseudomonadota bacterium]